MNKNSVKSLVILIACIILTSCNKEVQKTGIRGVTESAIERSEWEYTIMEEPKEIQNEETDNFIFEDNLKSPSYVMLMKMNTGSALKYCSLNEDMQWKEINLPWAKQFIVKKTDILNSIVIDSDNNFYTYITDEKMNGKLYRFGSNGKTTLDISAVLKSYPDLKCFTISKTFEDKLAFFFRDEQDDKWYDAMDKVILYDPVTENVIGQSDGIDPLQCLFGPDEAVYYISEENKGIVKKNLDENISNGFIRCEGITGDGSARLCISDDKGYVCTSRGIYGGSFDETEWTQIMSSDDYYKMNGHTYGISGFMRVSGREDEFFLQVYGDDIKGTKWIHYVRS